MIRKAETTDAERILDLTILFEEYLIELDDSLVQEPFSRDVYRKPLLQGLDDDKHRFYVYEENGEIIAFIDYWTYPEFLHGGLTGYLNNLFVSEDHRGQGVGSALLDHVMDEARKRGVVAMHVPVKPLNERAVEFYKKNGIDQQLAMMETRLDDH